MCDLKPDFHKLIFFQILIVQFFLYKHIYLDTQYNRPRSTRLYFRFCESRNHMQQSGGGREHAPKPKSSFAGVWGEDEEYLSSRPPYVTSDFRPCT